MTSINKFILPASVMIFCSYLVLELFVNEKSFSYLLIISLGLLALYVNLHPKLKSFAFTVWVFVFVAWALLYPIAFGKWFGIDLRILIVPLIQIIMFGMGTTLNISDFTRVFKMPLPVFIGIFLQYTTMPLAGFALASFFNFEPEIAAGIILIGSSPGGVASNLMTYLAGGNVALSVTMTSSSTLISPVMTPFLMQSLAGELVPIDFVAMMFSIMNMIIVPVVTGVIANKILYSSDKWANSSLNLLALTAISFILALIPILFPETILSTFSTMKNGIIVGLFLIGAVSLAKLIINNLLNGPKNWMDKTLPVISMAGIVFIIAIITARSSEKLLSVGLLLIAVAIIHNFIGYVAGYWLARVFKLDESSCRTVAFEVGLQNGGMATGLAMTVLNSAKAALAPAIFSPWMNVSGSVLATYWHRKRSVKKK
jgi:BASS family bile acid:Na+ symporter